MTFTITEIKFRNAIKRYFGYTIDVTVRLDVGDGTGGYIITVPSWNPYKDAEFLSTLRANILERYESWQKVKIGTNQWLNKKFEINARNPTNKKATSQTRD